MYNDNQLFEPTYTSAEGDERHPDAIETSIRGAHDGVAYGLKDNWNKRQTQATTILQLMAVMRPCIVYRTISTTQWSQHLLLLWRHKTLQSYMVTYLPLNYDTLVLRNIFEVTRIYVMDVGLRNAPSVYRYYPLSLPIHM